MRRIAFTRPDGGVSIIVPVISRDDPKDFTEAQALERAAKDIPQDAINFTIVNEDAIPADRTFRNAWRADGEAVVVDMDAAREVWRDKLREARKPLLEALDVAYQRADETGSRSEKDAVAAKKQALREITAHPSIEAAGTPNELKSVWPDDLGDKSVSPAGMIVA